MFDGKNEKLINNANVLVEGNLIKQVSTTPISAAGATVIDGKGRTLMPGLIDAHWHVMFNAASIPVLMTADMEYLTLLGARSAEETLLRGFTTVRDVGGNPFGIKRGIDQGMIVGPRIYASGPMISQTSGHSDNRPPTEPDHATYLEKNEMLAVADGVPAVLTTVRKNLRMGATQIKLSIGGGVSSNYDPLDVSEFTMDELKAAVEAAKSWNTYVAVHANTDASIRMAIEAGALSIEHGFLLEEDTIKLMAKKGIWLSIQPLLNDEDAFKFTGENQRKWIQVTDGTDKVYRLAKKYNVKIAFGTDLLFDPTLGQKQGKFLAKLKRWFSPYEALKMATSTNAELLAMCGPRNPYRAGPLGVVKEGAYADLLLVDGNPLQNLDLVADPGKNFVVIMKDGKIYKNTL
ncbi:MAG TPA: amidohydrolase family protein [Nitrospira sp.]|nr:amidohydrolase family protein [Nitrospira sp.]